MRRFEQTAEWTFHDSRQFYQEALQEFESIKGNYSGPLTRLRMYVSSFKRIDNLTSGQLKPGLAKEDLEALVNLTVDLDCLGMQGHFHEEATEVLRSHGIKSISSSGRDSYKVRDAYRETLQYKAPKLCSEIMNYIMHFSPKGWEEHGMMIYPSLHEALFGKKPGSR